MFFDSPAENLVSMAFEIDSSHDPSVVKPPDARPGRHLSVNSGSPHFGSG